MGITISSFHVRQLFIEPNSRNSRIEAQSEEAAPFNSGSFHASCFGSETADEAFHLLLVDE